MGSDDSISRCISTMLSTMQINNANHDDDQSWSRSRFAIVLSNGSSAHLMKTVTRISQRGTVAGSHKKDFWARSHKKKFFFSFFLSKKRDLNKCKKKVIGSTNSARCTPSRVLAPSELKNKRILGSAPYISTCVSFILRESSILVLPLIGLQARSRSRNLPGSPMHEEQAFSMHLMTSGLAGSQPAAPSRYPLCQS